MLNIESAKELVTRYVDVGEVIDTLTKQTEWGWVFFYGTNEDSVTPLMVDKERETVIRIGNGPIEEYINTYTTDRDEIIRQTNEKNI